MDEITENQSVLKEIHAMGGVMVYDAGIVRVFVAEPGNQVGAGAGVFVDVPDCAAALFLGADRALELIDKRGHEDHSDLRKRVVDRSVELIQVPQEGFLIEAAAITVVGAKVNNQYVRAIRKDGIQILRLAECGERGSVDAEIVEITRVKLTG